MNKMIDMIIEAYVSVYGVEKWNSLTDDEKCEVVMTIAKDFKKGLDEAEKAKK